MILRRTQRPDPDRLTEADSAGRRPGQQESRRHARAVIASLGRRLERAPLKRWGLNGADFLARVSPDDLCVIGPAIDALQDALRAVRGAPLQQRSADAMRAFCMSADSA